jgi:hypothetical protein
MNITEEQNAVGLGGSLWHSHVGVEVLASESHLFTRSDSEGPLGGNINIGGTKDLDEMVALSKFLAEIK